MFAKFYRTLGAALLCVAPTIFCHGQQSVVDSLSHLLAGHPDADTTRVNLLNQLSLKEQRYVPEKSKTHADEALTLALQLGYKKGEGYAYEALSRYAYTVGEYQDAVDYGLKMLSVFEYLEHRQGIATAYFNIGGAYMYTKDLKLAGSYLRRAIALDQETGNKPELLSSYNRYGLLLYHSGKFDSALLVHNRLLAMREEIRDQGGVAQACNNIGIVWVDKGDPDKAIPYFARALAIFEADADKLRTGGACQNLGNAYLRLGDYEKSEYYLKRSLALATELGTLFELQNAYGFLTDLEETRGNFKQALAYQKHYQQVLDSLYNSEKANILAEAETRYQTGKKEQTIKLLEKEKQIQNTWQYILAGGVLVIGVIYLLQRSRTKKARELLATQQVLNEKLKETDLMKSRFFANISHEFRTPLSLIIAPLEEKLKSPAMDARDKSDLRLAVRNANRLLSLVNQLLDLSRLEAGKMELQLAEGKLKNFFNLLTASFESLAVSKDIHFIQNNVLPDVVVPYDADKIEKIVTNLLFNAFKFTPPDGTVILEVSAPDEASLVIRVHDTGKGIPEEDQAYIFSPFYQSKHTLDDGQPGTGLGLALVSEMTQLYQGTIELSSKVDRGTSITVTIPVDWSAAGAEDQIQPIMPSAFVVQHILTPETPVATADYPARAFSSDETKNLLLVVEDNEALREFIVSIFSNEFSVITAADGLQGLAAAVTHTPDLVISDVMMPNMDGIELVDRIKTDERTSHIPVVLLTAKADVESRIQGLRNGADDYLSKPFSVEELRARVANLITLRKNLIARFKTQMLAPLHVEPQVTEPSLDEKFIRKVRDLIDEHISDPDFGVEHLAGQMYMSRSQLFRKFKALMDGSPSEYISDLRLEKAARLIAARADTVSQISYSVGFNDQSYFAKRFRKKYGMSPSEYAESA